MRAFRLAFILVLLAAAVVATLVLLRTSIAEGIAKAILAQRGFPDAALEISAITPSHIEIEVAQLGPGSPSAERITIAYTIGDIFRRRIREVIIEGVNAELDFAAAGTSDPSAAVFPLKGIPDRLFGLGPKVKVVGSHILLKNVGTRDLALDLGGEVDLGQKPARVSLRVTGTAPGHHPSREFISWQGDGVAGADGVRLSGTGQIRIDHFAIRSWVTENVSYDGVVRLETSADELLVDFDDRAQFDLSYADKSGRLDLAEPIRRAGAQQVKIGHVEGRWGVSADLDVEPFSFSVARGERPPIAIRVDAADLAVELNVRNGLQGAIHLVNGRFEAPDFDVRVEDAAATIPLRASRIGETAMVSGLLISTRPRALFSQQRFAIEAAPDDAGVLRLEGQLTPVESAARLTVSGSYDPATFKGELQLGADRIGFALGAMQPKDLSPALAVIRHAKGAVRLDSRVILEPDTGLTSQARVVFNGFDADFLIGRFEGVSGTVLFRDLDAPSTPPGQTLTARRFMGPLPVENANLRFQLVRAGRDPLIRIEAAEGSLSGGRVSLRDTAYRPKAEHNAMLINVEDLSLERFFEQWTKNRITGDGVVSGQIPIRIGADGLVIDHGALEAEDNGVLKVNWGEARDALKGQSKEVALMVEALEDFHFETFAVGLDRPIGSELELTLQLEGRNPQVLDGYPFRFNIHLSGNLETLLAALNEGRGLTMDMLRERLTPRQR